MIWEWLSHTAGREASDKDRSRPPQGHSPCRRIPTLELDWLSAFGPTITETANRPLVRPTATIRENIQAPRSGSITSEPSTGARFAVLT